MPPSHNSAGAASNGAHASTSTSNHAHGHGKGRASLPPPAPPLPAEYASSTRVKRKRVDDPHSKSGGLSSTPRGGAGQGQQNGVGSNTVQLDLSDLPPSAIHKYIAIHSLAPHLPPVPKTSTASATLPFSLRASPPPPPADPQPTLSAAGRPVRGTGADASEREDVDYWGAGDEEEEAILADRHEVHGLLSGIVERHYREQQIKEVETVVSFVYALKAKDRALKVVPPQ